jgi:hypothetical protein
MEVTMLAGGGVTAKHPEIVAKLTDPVNDFAAVDQVAKALLTAGIAANEIDKFWDQAIGVARKRIAANLRAVGHFGALS